MVARLCAFVVWALVAATVVFWGLRLFVRAPAAPAYAVAVGDASAVRADLSRVLGSAPVAVAVNAAAPEVSSRFKLFGIMAPKGPAAAKDAGVALIAVDGKPPKAFVVGSRLDEGIVLQSVSLRTASLGPAQGAPAVKLELPVMPMAATGTLPAVSNSNNPSPGFSGPQFSAPQAIPGRPSLGPGPVPAGLGGSPPVFVPPSPSPAPSPVPPAPMPGQIQIDPQQLPNIVPPPSRPDPNSALK